MSITARYLDDINTVELILPLGGTLERAWDLITQPDLMKQWFPFTPRYEQRVGAVIYFTGDQYADDFEGSVLTWNPVHEFAFDWGGSTITLTLELGQDGAVLTLRDGLADKQEAARNAAGWEQCLQELSKLNKAGAADGPHSANAVPWQPLYEKYVDAGFPNGAPVPTIN